MSNYIALKYAAKREKIRSKDEVIEVKNILKDFEARGRAHNEKDSN